MLAAPLVLAAVLFPKDVAALIDTACAQESSYMLLLLPDAEIPSDVKFFLTNIDIPIIVYRHYTANTDAVIRRRVSAELNKEEPSVDPVCLKRNFQFMEEAGQIGEFQMFYQAKYSYKYIGELDVMRIGQWYDFFS